MLDTCAKSVALRIALTLLLATGMLSTFGCTETDADSGSGGSTEEEQPTEESPERPVLPTSWVITVVDDDSFTEGEITYSIALNLTATNPSQSIDGTYSGSATAKTDTVGVVEGLPLNASAIANSSMLEFTLVDQTGVTSDGLAPQTSEESIYSGTGRIVMAASGSGTVGPAGGGFSNTSGEPVEVLVQGSAVTFKVTISGHTYTFQGTITGV